MTDFKLHTPEELQKIAEEDFDKFYQIAKEYYHTNSTYYAKNIRPLLNRLNKEKKNIKAEPKISSNPINEPLTIEVNSKDSDVSLPLTNLTNISSVFCTKCGSQNRRDSNYCFNCGNGLIENNSGKRIDGLEITNDNLDFNKLNHYCLSCNNKVMFENDLCDNCKSNQGSQEEEYISTVHRTNRRSPIIVAMLFIGILISMYSFIIRPSEKPIDLSIPPGTFGSGLLENTYNIQSKYEYESKRIEYEKRSAESNMFLYLGGGLVVLSVILLLNQKTNNEN
jgi:hypothetical protein